MEVKLIYQAIVWALFYALHSVLASSKIKYALNQKLPSVYKYYRDFYNLFSLFTFYVAYKFKNSYNGVLLFNHHPIIFYASMVIIALGIALAAISFKNYNIKEFIGLASEDITHPLKVKLKVTGLNQWVRHPLYFATIILLAGWFLLSPSASNAIFILVTLVYLPFGIYWEEKKLIRIFGEEYILYKKRVKCLIPYLI